MSNRCATRLRLPSHSLMVRAMRSRSIEARDVEGDDACGVGIEDWGILISPIITALYIVCSSSLMFPGHG